MAKSKNPAAVALGRKGGQARSERKTAAVRLNAAKGGKVRSEAKAAAARANAAKGGRPSRLLLAAEAVLRATTDPTVTAAEVGDELEALRLAVEVARKRSPAK
jgi:hypothetical protein